MISRYQVTHEGLKETKEKPTWISVTNATIEEKKRLASELNLPVEAIEAQALPEEVTHLNVFDTHSGEEVMVDTLIHYKKQENGEVEKGLIPVTFLLIDHTLVTITRREEDEVKFLIEDKIKADSSPEELLITYLLYVYGEYMEELKRQKQQIDRVYSRAKDSMERKLLIELTDIERNLVYLEQTLLDQNETVRMVLEQKKFEPLGEEKWKEKAIDQKDFASKVRAGKLNKVTVRMETALKMVRLYRELVNSTSGLISDMMDNKLNNIMEQLQTISLILTVPMMIFSLWGINTGGLIGREQPWGSAAVVLLAVVLGILTWIWLDRKEF